MGAVKEAGNSFQKKPLQTVAKGYVGYASGIGGSTKYGQKALYGEGNTIYDGGDPAQRVSSRTGGGGAPSGPLGGIAQPGYENPFQSKNKKDYTFNPTTVNQHSLKGLNALRNEALTPSAQSPWLQMQKEQVETNRRQGIDLANRDEAGGLAQGRASLAMHGGLGGGASERLAMSGSRNAALSRQDANRVASEGNLSAGQAAETNRLNMLGNYAGREQDLATGNADIRNRGNMFNVGNKLSAQGAQQQAGQNAYQQQMQAYGADQYAQALEKQGKKDKGLFGGIFG